MAEQQAINRQSHERNKNFDELVAEQRQFQAEQREFNCRSDERTQKVQEVVLEMQASQQQLMKPALELSSISVNIPVASTPLQHTSLASSGNVTLVFSPPSGPPSVPQLTKIAVDDEEEDDDVDEDYNFDHMK